MPTAHAILVDALTHMAEVGASDLHLKAGYRPSVRVDGLLRPAPLPALSGDDTDAVVASVIPERWADRFARTHEADFAVTVAGLGRFRLAAFRERGCAALAVRSVAATVPDADTLGLLPAVRRLATHVSGLVLVAGRVGSGKSTTLAWIVDRINETRSANIVTIEDPIEYVHSDKRAIVHQREVGVDTESHAAALHRVLRQDPDVIVVGEIRDADTARTAITAAQTGHLVLSTLHTDTADETVDRLIELFPGHRQAQARLSVAACLQAVVCQRLVTRAADRRMILAQEVLVSTGRIVARIVDPTAAGPSLTELVAEDDYLGMVTFDQHLDRLHRDGMLSRSDALAAATNPHDLGLALDQIGAATSHDRPR